MRDIVLVHSNEKLANIYQQRLAKHFRVKTAFDGLSGVRLIKQKTPHMVIAEYDLPWLSGLGILKFVRGHLPTIAIPVIFLSHRVPEFKALNHGANDWINVSDVSVDDFIDRIFYHLITNKIIK